LVLLYRNEAGVLMQRRMPAEYSSFYRYDRIEPHLRELQQNRFCRGYTVEGDWVRVRWTDHWVRKKAVGHDSPFAGLGVEAYEGDVDPVRRYMADTGAQVAKPRRCYLDFETDSRVSPRRAAEGEARILSFVVVWEVGEHEGVDVFDHLGDANPDLRGQLGRVDWVIGCIEDDTDAEERNLIESLFSILEDFDQVLAWNGDDFDFALLPKRIERTRANTKDLRRWLLLDQMVMFERMNRNAAESGDEKQSFKLGSICRNPKILGTGKDDFDVRRTYEAWAAGGDERERMLRYMVRDAVLQAALEKRVGHADVHQAVSEVCGVFPDSRGLNPTRFVDGYMLRRAVESGTHFPTKHFTENQEQFEGAWVMEPKTRGFIDNVHVCDFKSLYPSIILTWNMSPETKSRDCPVNGPIPLNTCRSPVNRVGFRTDKRGVLTEALRELIRLRDHYKKLKTQLPPNTPEWKDADRKSMAYKVAANSFYGVVGSHSSRFFDRDIAEGVTQNGVWLLKKTFEVGESQTFRLELIYADTDSGLAVGGTPEEFNAFVDWCNRELYPRILQETGCVENHISLAYEKQFERILFSGKKRYVARMRHYGWNAKKGDWNWATDKSEPEVKGLEWKRGDTNRIAREMQWEVISLMAGADANVAKDPTKYLEILERYRRKVLEEPLTVDEVKQAKAVQKETKEYVAKKKKDGTDAAVQAHVRVARILEQRGEQVVVGSKIDFVIQDGSKDHSNGLVAIPASDYDGTNVDRHYLWENLVVPPTQRLLEAAFPDRSWKEWSRTRPSKRERTAATSGQAGLFGEQPKAAPRASDPQYIENLRFLKGAI
jgi:DNA polymerase elongation subunit (family B)